MIIGSKDNHHFLYLKVSVREECISDRGFKFKVANPGDRCFYPTTKLIEGWQPCDILKGTLREDTNRGETAREE
ncbi:MAG: hypothetical protein ABI472_21280 [Ginsengibacter sp.]